MNIQKLSVVFVLFAGPIALLASPATDAKIEDAAKGSYNFRVVLDNHVRVKADDGAVTLTGVVSDEDDKTLAADTVQNLPGVTDVQNLIIVGTEYPKHSDAWMAFKIRGRLLVKGHVSATDTKVAVTDGNVVLTGTADNIAQKELTAAYAKDIDGVKTVKNDIVVNAKPVGETVGENIDDASITSQVKLALLTHKSTSALGTKVTTTNGVVHVSGEAASDAEKSLVTKLAEDVRGTKSVENDMTVKS